MEGQFQEGSLVLVGKQDIDKMLIILLGWGPTPTV